MMESEEDHGRDVAPTLTEGQTRHLRVCLGGLLSEAEDLLRWTRESDSSDEPWVRSTATELERLLSALEETVDSLGLSVRERSVDPRHRVAAWASTWWGSILDCRPSALRGYGAVHPETGRSLAPRVEGIADLLLRIEALSRSAGP